MSTRTSADRYPTVRLGYDPSLVESDLAAMERAHQTVVDDAAAKIAALENALALASSRHNTSGTPTAPAASAEAEQLITSARREAFKLITEARKEASAVVEEARAELGGQPVVPAPQPSNADALRAEEQRLEARIGELQRTLAGLEEGIRSLTGMLRAKDAPVVPGHAPLSSTPPAGDHVPVQPFAVEGATSADPAGNGGELPVEPHLPPRRKPSPPPPPPPLEPEAAAPVQHGDLSVEIDEPSDLAAPAPDGGSRASFYSRRSAQLPHIGAEAGRDAISMAADLRSSFNQ